MKNEQMTQDMKPGGSSSFHPSFNMRYAACSHAHVCSGSAADLLSDLAKDDRNFYILHFGEIQLFFKMSLRALKGADEKRIIYINLKETTFSKDHDDDPTAKETPTVKQDREKHKSGSQG